MRAARTLIAEMKRGVQNLAYNNALYQKMLASGEVPDRLYFSLPDLWPGYAGEGARLMQATSLLWGEPEAQAASLVENLRNLRAVGSDAARTKALALVTEGIHECQAWDDRHWTPAALGERIYAFTSFFDFYASRAPADFHAQLAESLYRQWKHLWRTMPASLGGLPALQAVMGLLLGSLNFPEGDRVLGLACDFLRRLLATDIARDGMHVSRNPEIHRAFLQYLVTCRLLFRVAELPLPDDVRVAIGAMTPVLKFFRYGDGALGLFQGGGASDHVLIEALITQAEVKTRTPRRLTHSSYERIQAGRSLLMLDGGLPAGADGHAGLGAFEFSHGRERILVNCGVPHHATPEWRQAMAATAAHTTLTLNDTNAVDLDKLATVRHRGTPHLHRYEEVGEDGQTYAVAECGHGGYAGLGATCTRILKLSEEGDRLTGEERIEGREGLSYALRFHLHPDLTVALSQDEQGVLLRTPSGSGWRLRSHSGSLALEASVYCGTGHRQPSQHIRLSGTTKDGVTVLDWSLVRERK